MQNVMPLRRKRGDVPDTPALPEPVQPEEPRPEAGEPRVAPDVVAADPSSDAETEITIARVDAVDVRTLMSLALNCTLVATLVAAIGATLLWIFATAIGVVGRAESFMESIGFRDFHVSALQVILGTVLVVGGIALVVATAAVVAGAAYNVFALHGHGLQVRVANLRPSEVDALEAAPDLGRKQWVRHRHPAA